jgi:hypothetical protein
MACVANARAQEAAGSLWDLAQRNKGTLTVSTLFDAQQVRDHLSTDKGIDEAIDWCRRTAVTRVFIETFRDGYQADKPALEHAKKRFAEAGFAVSGCITTTAIGKRSTGWSGISCYTDVPTQEHLQRIFEFTAGLFDEIMIDDFLFSDCECEACKAAKGDQSWADYRCDLMVRMSRERILGAARAVNPKVRIIIKYPQWYDAFHQRGYEVIRQTADFDITWVGTETRDYDDARWGGKVQYEAYYIMRWLGEIGGPKCGGGWFDWLGTTEETYLEQACQTVLADAKEMMLFCYGGLLSSTGPANVARLRNEMPSLFELAKLVRGRPIRGVAAPKPPNSDAGKEAYVYDFVGMLGLPLVPTGELDPRAMAAFWPVHVLKDAKCADKLNAMLKAKRPILITDGLAEKLEGVNLDDANLAVLKVAGDPKNLLKLTREELTPIRNKLLAPLGITFDAPNKTALYLFADDLIVIENFNDEPIDVQLTLPKAVTAKIELTIPHEGKASLTTQANTLSLNQITPRTLIAFTCN